MPKPQFVVTAVVLEGWGKLKGYAVSDRSKVRGLPFDARERRGVSA